MNKRLLVCFALLLVLAAAGATVHHSPAAAQDDLNCEERILQAEELMQQRETALANGDVLIATSLMRQTHDLLAPCAASPSTRVFEAGSENDWLPVERSFDSVAMVQVPGGCFLMGNEAGESDEQPVHEVCFDFAYWIDKTEVTRASYAECVAAGACTPTPDSDVSTRDTQPINRVTWRQADAYCAWRGLQLPSEAEWEYAARGPEGLLFPWGNTFEREAVVYANNSDGAPADVGSRPSGASWAGALDMSGNVSEWTRTVYQSYPNDPGMAAEDNPRVIRGGSYFRALSYDLNTTNRNARAPAFELDQVGFRCVDSFLPPLPSDASCPARYERALELLANERFAVPDGRIGFALRLLDNARTLLEPCLSNEQWQPETDVFNGVEMASVPPGCFMMGRDDGARDTQPAYEVCIDTAYWIDKTEVTRAEYAECVAAGACTEAPASQYADQPAQPVNRVTWFQAYNYCAWRGVRLPTEAEWEYAARGPDDLLYPWGNMFAVRNVVHDSRDFGPETVGSRPSGASWVGALDLSGNIGEWVSSMYMPYPYTPDDGRENLGGTDARVWRGGSFYDFDQQALTATRRNRLNPESEIEMVGIRCAQSGAD